MAISTDLLGIQSMIDTIDLSNDCIRKILCDNIIAIAEQVEALENLPVVTKAHNTKRSFIPPAWSRCQPAERIQ